MKKVAVRGLLVGGLMWLLSTAGAWWVIGISLVVLAWSLWNNSSRGGEADVWAVSDEPQEWWRNLDTDIEDAELLEDTAPRKQ